MPKCTFLIGLPAAGKSTWIDANTPVNTVVLSTDRIIDRIAKNYNVTYDEAWRNLVGFAEQIFFKNLEEISESGDHEGNKLDFVIDRTNLNVKSRRRVMNTLKAKGYTFKAIVFTPSNQTEWFKRLEQRTGKIISPDVLLDMVQKIEDPTLAEGFDEIEYYKE